MNNFNKLYEDIFKPASPEEVIKRKEESRLEKFKEFLSKNNINYEDIKNKPSDMNLLSTLHNKGFSRLYEVIVDNEELRNLFYDKYINIIYNNRTFLVDAIIHQLYKLCEVLIKHGADVNIKNTYDETPLIPAVLFSSIDIIKLLLDNGADPNIKNSGGFYPLHYAISKGDIKVIELLLKHGADVNVKDKTGYNILKLAKTHKNYDKIINLLIQYGAKE